MKIAIMRERADGETARRRDARNRRQAHRARRRRRDRDRGGRGRALPRCRLRRRPARRSSPSAAAAVKGADVVLAVRRPDAALLAGVNTGRAGDRRARSLRQRGRDRGAGASAGVTAIAMEFMPRITRAQVMDILSSQANLAGYQAVIDAAARVRPRLPDDDDRGRHGPAGQGLRHGRGRCRASRPSRPPSASARW